MTGPVQHFGVDLPETAGPTALDGLLSDLKVGQAHAESAVITVPGRPGWAVRYRTDIPYEHLMLWQTGATSDQGILDKLTLAVSVLLFACEGLVHGDEPVTAAGSPVTFMHPQLQAQLRAGTPAAALRAFYPQPISIIDTAEVLLDTAGYSENRERPTKR